MIYYFSGTGNSRMIAHRIAEMTHDHAVAIQDRSAATDKQTQVLGLVFPVYAWGLPRVMKRFIQQLELPHVPQYLYAICTCGDDIGKTDVELRKVLQQKRWPLHAIWSVTMPNTYVALPGFDVDDQQTTLNKLESSAQRTAAIACCIEVQKKDIADVRPGNWPGLKSYVLRPLFNALLTGDYLFKANDSCTHCKICSNTCPMHNIEHGKDGKPRWKNHCADCLACYHSCPQHAISYGPFTNNKGQYLLRKFLQRHFNLKERK